MESDLINVRPKSDGAISDTTPEKQMAGSAPTVTKKKEAEDFEDETCDKDTEMQEVATDVKPLSPDKADESEESKAPTPPTKKAQAVSDTPASEQTTSIKANVEINFSDKASGKKTEP